MEELRKNWQVYTDTLPLPNSIVMVGEIAEDEPMAQETLVLDSAYFIELAVQNDGRVILLELDIVNYPQSKQGKIVVQFQLNFPRIRSFKKFIRLISP